MKKSERSCTHKSTGRILAITALLLLIMFPVFSSAALAGNVKGQASACSLENKISCTDCGEKASAVITGDSCCGKCGDSKGAIKCGDCDEKKGHGRKHGKKGKHRRSYRHLASVRHGESACPSGKVSCASEHKEGKGYKKHGKGHRKHGKVDCASCPGHKDKALCAEKHKGNKDHKDHKGLRKHGKCKGDCDSHKKGGELFKNCCRPGKEDCHVCGRGERKWKAHRKFKKYGHHTNRAKVSICTAKGNIELPESSHIARVSTSQLGELIRSRRPFVLLDARTGKFDDGRRIPGARALSPFCSAQEAKALIPDRRSLVITYCSGLKCPASHKLALRLSELGYVNLAEYPFGVQGWEKVHYPFERSLGEK